MIKTEKLLNVLESVNDGVAKKAIVADYENFVFQDNMVCTNNDEVFFLKRTDLEFGKTFGVRANELLNFVGRISAEEVESSFEDEEFQLKWKRTEMGMKYSEVSDTYYDPYMTKLIEKDSWHKLKKNKLPDSFVTALSLVNSCVSKDLTDEISNSVHFSEDYVEATDNYRIARYTFDDSIFHKDFLVPASSVAIIVKNKPHYLLRLNDSSRIYFMNKEMDLIFACRVYNGEYHPTEKYLFPQGDMKEITFSEDVIDAINRAEIFNVEEDSIRLVDLHLRKRFLTISSEKEIGRYREKAKVGYSGEDFSFKIDLNALRDILALTTKGHLYDNVIKFKTSSLIYVNSLINN
ncbi:MAG TPA: hypothetical protein DDX98_08585 [Bacteroidales bacterium]|mgnify:CR=1 FL=1|jgi:hypothetical protein|nr:hypothetical protein [Bacteroidales bacterium]